MCILRRGLDAHIADSVRLRRHDRALAVVRRGDGVSQRILRSDDGGSLRVGIERLEELQLRGQVSLASSVKVQMIVGQSREDGNPRVDTVNAVEFESM